MMKKRTDPATFELIQEVNKTPFSADFILLADDSMQ